MAVTYDLICDPSKVLVIAWGPKEGLTDNNIMDNNIDNTANTANNHCNMAIAEQKCAQQYSANEDVRAH